MWLLMAPTHARRVDPLTGAPFPAGAALAADPALSARAHAARAAAADALQGRVIHLGAYLFAGDGSVLGRMPGVVDGAAHAGPPPTPETPPPVGGPGPSAPSGSDGVAASRASGMSRALARFKISKRQRVVVPVGDAEEEGAGGVEEEGGKAIM